VGKSESEREKHGVPDEDGLTFSRKTPKLKSKKKITWILF